MVTIEKAEGPGLPGQGTAEVPTELRLHDLLSDHLGYDKTQQWRTKVCNHTNFAGAACRRAERS